MECIKIEKRGDIDIRTISDQNKNHSKVYNRKGVVLPRIVLQGIYIEQLKAFRSLDKDLRNILVWICKLQEINDKDGYEENKYPDMAMGDAAIVKALFVAILSMYGRCFTTANNRKFTFDRKHVPEKYRETHDELMNARHNFAAHKGEFKYDDCKIVLVLNNDKRDPGPIIFAEMVQPYIYTDIMSKNNELQSLCEALRRVVNEKYDNLTEKIFNDFVQVKGKAFWLKSNGKVVSTDSMLGK